MNFLEEMAFRLKYGECIEAEGAAGVDSARQGVQSWRNEMHSILLCCLELAIRPCGVAHLIEHLLSTQGVLGLIPNTD